MCREYIDKNFKVDEVFIYEDKGFSGSNVDRPRFQKMLKDARAGKFDAVVCYRLDRINRNISDFSNLREQFNTSTPLGLAMMYIASVFAQLEHEAVAERIQDICCSLPVPAAGPEAIFLQASGVRLYHTLIVI